MSDPGGDWQGHSMDADARRARRDERRRRARRRRVIGVVAVIAVLVVAGGAIAALTRGGGGEGQPAASTTPASTTAAATTAPATTAPATTAPATTTAPADSAGGLPSAQEQSAAVAKVREVGVPLYRTPGTAGKVVALTFDDGPGPYSETTVETLKKYGMRATFFLCGKSVVRFPKDPAIEATVAAMGDHSWNHPYLPGLPAAEMRSEIARTQKIVETTSGAPVEVFRSPYGARTPAIDATANELGMIQVLWSLESGDSAGAAWDAMLSKIKATLKPGDIILFHENRGQTQKVVNRLVPWMKKNGWRSVSVPEMLAMDPPSPEFLRNEAGRYIAK